MTIEDDIALLEAVPTFAPLGPDALRIIAIGAESRAMGAGAVLFRAGEIADCGYVIESGSFTLLSPHPKLKPVTAWRGALLGELALLTATRRPVTATAQEPSFVMRIARPLFLRMLDGYPDVAERLRETMLHRTEQLTTELVPLRHTLQVGAAPRLQVPPAPEGEAAEAPPIAPAPNE